MLFCVFVNKNIAYSHDKNKPFFEIQNLMYFLCKRWRKLSGNLSGKKIDSINEQITNKYFDQIIAHWSLIDWVIGSENERDLSNSWMGKWDFHKSGILLSRNLFICKWRLLKVIWMIENAKFSGFDVKEKFWKTESQ
jgi:hypothetical protein